MQSLKHNIFKLLFVGIIAGCQSAPTSVIEQSVNIFEKNIVLLDTRSDLEFTSFHITGSKNLLVDDFLILKNPLAKEKIKKRILDPDIQQTVERLAHKGVSPELTIYLIGDIKNSINNKKWKWLLSNLEISDVALYSIEDIKKIKNGRFSEAEKKSAWILKSSPEFQKEFIFKKAPNCFITWSEKNCL
jgi:hypothetical protein